MNTAPAPLNAPSTVAADAVVHLWCCERTRALCGVELDAWTGERGPDCVVCLDLADAQVRCHPDCPVGLS